MKSEPPTANLSRILDWARHRHGPKPALIWEDRIWTYAELDAEVNAAAAFLREAGVGLGTRMAVLSMNRPEFLILALALAKLGAVIVPLNYRLHDRELAFLVQHAAVTGLASESEFESVADGLVSGRPEIECRIALDEMADEWQGLTGGIERHLGLRVADAELRPGDLARILYTSGTTSRPKGVMITHGNIGANMNALVVDLDLTERDVTLNASPLYHVAGLDIPGAAIWYVGGTMTLLRRFDPGTFLSAMETHGVTGTCIGATVTHMIRTFPGVERFDLSAVRWLVFGQVAPKLQVELGELFPNARLVESYGMTEACNGVSACDAAHQHTKPGSVGRPHHWVDIKIVDEDDNEVAPGVFGEIIVRGAKVSPGYLDDPGSTARSFRNGWFHTGDGGYMDEDGYLYIRDRIKDMIRSGSENIASSEVEAVIYEHAGVTEAAVVAMPHPKWVEVPVAFVAPAPGAVIDAAALIERCRANLGSYKVPKAVYVVEQLPRTPSGKVLKRDLRDLLGTLQPAWSAEGAPASEPVP